MVDTVQTGFTAPSADGVVGSMRGGRLNDLVMSELQPRFAEMTIRGRSYSLGLLATTTGVAAGNINIAAAAASTQFALWNPLNSGVNVILNKFMAGLISGTVVGGPLFHNIFAGALPTIASVGTAYNNLIGQTYNGQAKFVASAAGTTLTGGSALLNMRASNITFSAGTYAALGGSLAYEELFGDIVLPPGAGWAPCFASAGTSVLNSYGVTWFEIPV